jgi:uncharacterized protein (DUF1330 family)
MSAYVIIDLDIADPEGFQPYADQVGPLLEKAGARNLFFDADVMVMEGDWKPSQLIIFEFPDEEAVQNFWNSPEYQPLKELRRQYSTAKVIVGRPA